MSTFTPLTKNSATMTPASKNASTGSAPNKSIHPWTYNQAGFKYNQVTDTASIYPVYYNSIGQESFTPLPKS